MAFKADTNHWAYQDGANVAKQSKDSMQRGLMSLGLSMAATKLDEENTRQWLAGYDTTVEFMKTEVAPEPQSTMSGFDYQTGAKL